MNDIIWKLLRQHISKGQLIGFAIANLIGLTIVLLAVQFYRDVRPVFNDEESFISKDYLIITRAVTGAGAMMGSNGEFGVEDIADLEGQPWCRQVGRFLNSDFAVDARLGVGSGHAMHTQFFFEAIPDEFIDIDPSQWGFSPDKPEVPVVISRDYLSLYNFGFAATQGMPKISEGQAEMLPLEFTLSGISRIIPHEIDEDLFRQVFPDQEIKDADAFSKAMKKEIERQNAQQSDYLFVNQVRKALIDQFDAPLPEDFLKRWFASRGEKEMTPESIEADWTEKYVPSLKWELIESKLEEIQPVEPTSNQIVDYIKDILRKNDKPAEGETAEQTDQRLEQAARSIAADRQNVSQIVDRLYADNLAKVFKDQLKPTVEKVSAKEFAERAKE